MLKLVNMKKKLQENKKINFIKIKIKIETMKKEIKMEMNGNIKEKRKK